jgi:hypothetical protein
MVNAELEIYCYETAVALGYIPLITEEVLRKTTGTIVRIVSVPAEIRVRHILNTEALQSVFDRRKVSLPVCHLKMGY